MNNNYKKKSSKNTNKWVKHNNYKSSKKSSAPYVGRTITAK
jgi:hypothetical protein